MASLPKARFTIDVRGVPKTLLTLVPSKKGELRIILKKAAKYVGVRQDVSSPMTGAEIKEQRYSIHTTASIPDKNGITHTLSVDGFPAIKTYHHTKAIKSGKRFALIYARRAPDLTLESYNAPDEPHFNCSIGQYDPSIFTLFYAVFVGRSGLEFKIEPPLPHQNVQIFQKDIGDYRIVIMFSFVSLPSSPNGLLTHAFTLAPTQDATPEARASSLLSEEGGTPIQFVPQVFKTWMEMSDALLDEISRKGGVTQHFHNGNMSIDFYAQGIAQTP